MKAFIATECRIYRIKNEYYVSSTFYKILERYKKVFGSVTLCTRIVQFEKERLPEICEFASDIIDNIISINSLEDVALGKLKDAMKEEIDSCNLVIARIPSIVAYQAASIARKKRIPYLIEVVGCAWDSYWNYSKKSKFFAIPFFLMMRMTAKHASYATYVTERFLQRRYPCTCPAIHASNVIINCSEDGLLQQRIDKIEKMGTKLVLLTTAAIDVAYKGQEYVIRAINELSNNGIIVEYRLAGSGNPERLKRIAKECNVEENVVFLGSLSREGVMHELDNCDIYIQPSLQEGLPRSMIEAMSRGCPALGANTAGIPELIAPECVFKRAEPSDIVEAIVNIIKSDLRKYAEMNYHKALEYDYNLLEKRRNDFYRMIVSEIT